MLFERESQQSQQLHMDLSFAFSVKAKVKCASVYIKYVSPTSSSIWII